MAGMLAALAVAVLLPQGALAGRVLGPDGEGAPQATVTLLHRPIARHAEPAREHRVVCTTDERGTFRATLRTDAVYSVWAANGTLASTIEEGVGAGGFLELRLDPRSQARKVVVEGLDAWEDAATLRFRTVAGGEHLDFVELPCHGGQLQLPPLPPATSRTIEVVGPDDDVVTAASLGATDAVARLRPPVEREVVVTDTGGAPLADVEVRAHVTNYWGTHSPGVPFGERFHALWPHQGRTDARGRLTVRVGPLGAGRLWLVSAKPGFAASVDGMHDGVHFRAGRVLPAEQQPPDDSAIAVVLQPAVPAVVDLRDGERPVGVHTLFLMARVHVARDRGATGVPFPVAVPITDGRAALDPVLPPAAKIERAWTELAPERRDELRTKLGFAPPIAFRIDPCEGLAREGATVRFDPAQWRSLQVITADGRPAARTVVHVTTAANASPAVLRTDALGRIALPADGDVRAAVIAREGTGAVTIGRDEPSPTTLALEPTPMLGGRAVDADGAPVAGASVTGSLRAAGPGAVPPEFAGVVALLDTCTDAAGRFTLPLPPCASTLVVTVLGAHGGKAVATIPWDPEHPAGDETVFELR